MPVAQARPQVGRARTDRAEPPCDPTQCGKGGRTGDAQPAFDRATYVDSEHGRLEDSEAAVRDENGRTTLRDVLAAGNLHAQRGSEHRGHEIDQLRVVAERVD